MMISKRKQALVVALLATPLLTFANWQMVGGNSLDNAQPFFQDGQKAPKTPMNANTNFPVQFKALGKQAFNYSMKLQPGSLKGNIESLLAGQWTVKWKSDYDYTVIGNPSFTGNDAEDTLEKVLDNYPLHATFYKGNGIVVITSRKA